MTLHRVLSSYAPELRKLKSLALGALGSVEMARRKLRPASEKGRLVLLSLGGRKGSPYVASAASALGYDLIVVSPTFPRWESRFARDWIVCDPFGDYSELLEKVASVNPKAVLVEQRNILLPIKARLIESLKLRPYGDLSHRTSNSKVELRQAIDRAGAPNLPWCLLENYTPERMPFPFVLKPETGTGSRGITVVENEDDFDLARTRLKALENDETVGGRIFLEKAVPGRQFDVEGIYFDGECFPLALIEEHYDNVGKAMPSAWYLFSPPIPAELRARLLQAACTFTRALGVINGAFHCEMRVDADGGIYVIDYSNRMGYPHLVSTSSGHAFPRAYVMAMAGERPDLSSVEQNIVYHEYIRDEGRYNRYLRLIKDHPDLIIQKNMLPFQVAGIKMFGRIALRETSFEAARTRLAAYGLVPKQWGQYYPALEN